MRLLVTGGAGFIGSNFVRYALNQPDIERVLVLDALTYAGNPANLSPEVRADPRFLFWHGDVRDRDTVEQLVGQSDVVVHFAAETHVDNSIYNSSEFVESDVRGTQVLLDAVNSAGIDHLIHISTSEVYGTSQQHLMNEEHLLNPRSPYAAAKTGAERLAYSYWATFQTPVTIVRPFNNYGPHQHLEKLIPCFISHALRDEPLPMHGTGKSTRDWIFVEDTCRGVDAIMRTPRHQTIGEVFNLGTGVDTSVLEITEQLLTNLDQPRDLIQTVAERPGQVDRHCADFSKVTAVCGWEPKVTLEDGLRRTVEWYVANREWWDAPESKGPGQRPWWDIDGISEAQESGQLGRLIEQAKR